MEQQEAQDLLNAVALQRDTAMNASAQLSAQIAKLQREIASLKSNPEGKRKKKPIRSAPEK